MKNYLENFLKINFKKIQDSREIKMKGFELSTTDNKKNENVNTILSNSSDLSDHAYGKLTENELF